MFGNKKKDYVEDECVAYLMSTNDPVEVSLIIGLLEDAKIGAMAKSKKGSGVMNVIAGYSLLGTDIYVERARLDEAKELVAAYIKGDGEIDTSDMRDDAE